MNDYFFKSSIWPAELKAISPDERALVVQIAIAQLPEADREIIFALFFDNLTEADVGLRFGITRGGVYMRMLKIKRLLHFKLAQLLKVMAC
jgi:DNA-directed RNA polymerase specialized sigma24 family protein